MRKIGRLFTLLVALQTSSLWTGSALAIEGSGKDWGTRDTGACVSIQIDGPPSPEQVATMVRCKHEVLSAPGGELWLMENIVVNIGAPTPFVQAYVEYEMEDGDLESTAYALRGSYTWSVCKNRDDAAKYGGDPNMNCYETDVPSAKGVCWKTTFLDWRCRLNGAAVGRREPTAPPQ